MKMIIDIPEGMLEAIKEGYWSGSHKLELAIRNGIPYEEKPKYFPPCEDCNKKMEEIRQAYDKMKAMEGPHGKWLHNSDRPDNLICSVCNCGWDMWRYESKELKYCPNCGAEMKEV